ncbi:MAG: hypothetical protein ACLFR0_07825 [Alphaproteobacteria bacterium]
MTQSIDPLIISGMAENNARHKAGVRAYLDRIIPNREEHAKFMNMLSMLEHMGSRKIMVSQMHKGDTLTEDTLKHLAEEARHAYFFKRQAERAAQRSLDGWNDENTTARVPALMYFGRMDAGITKRLAEGQTKEWHPEQSEMKSSGAEGSQPKQSDPSTSALRASAQDDNKEAGGSDPYYWVSLIIELRACWLYTIYQEALEASDYQLSLKSLIAEEDGHLEEMFEMCGENTELLRELSAFETQLFEKLWSQIENTVQIKAAA